MILFALLLAAHVTDVADAADERHPLEVDLDLTFQHSQTRTRVSREQEGANATILEDELQHTRATEESSAVQVSGHRAWKIEFAMDYTDGASQGLTWTTELGAVVVVDRGPTEHPAVFYVSVPATLGVPNVDVLIDSLTISSSNLTYSGSSGRRSSASRSELASPWRSQ